jgi:hypothetical protein
LSEISEIPLLKGRAITIAATDLNVYYELLRVQADPNRILYIRDITIESSDTTSIPEVKVYINGTPYLQDFPIFLSSAGVGFGHLRSVEGKDPLVVSVRKTAAGLGAVTVACIVSGTQVPRGSY